MYYVTFFHNDLFSFHSVSEAKAKAHKAWWATGNCSTSFMLQQILITSSHKIKTQNNFLSPYIFDGLEDILHSQRNDAGRTAVSHHSECLPRWGLTICKYGA